MTGVYSRDGAGAKRGGAAGLAAWRPGPYSRGMQSPGNESTNLAPSLDATLTRVDAALAEAEGEVAAALKSLRRLRRAAQEGNLAGLADGIAAAADATAQAAEPVRRGAAALEYDVAASFADGAYIEELAQVAQREGLALVRRDGRIVAYPVALRLDAKAPGVRLGRRLERRIRPSFLVRQLKALQTRPGRFNATAFLDRLLGPYALLAPREQPGWRADRPGAGPLVALADLHAALTFLPAAAADYPLEEFTCDLLRLDREPTARARRGHRFELGGSTGKKGAKRLTLFDEQGTQHDYFAIRFTQDA